MKYMPAQIVAILLFLGPNAFADISVEILTVGFTGEGGHLYRGGSYAPLGVRLTLTNESERQVNVRVEQYDLDGDIVVDELAIALTPDLKGSRSRWLYFVPNPGTSVGAQGLSLQVVDENGTALEVVHQGERKRKVSLPNSPEVIEEKSFLILSIGEQTKGKVGTISDYQADEDSPFIKPIRVAHISPDLVPDHWIGLEMVDAIVWEAANPTPTAMTLNQQRALLDWVRHGGRLLIAAGNTSDALKNSEFRDFLPVRITGVKAESILPGELPHGSWNRQSSEEDVEYPEPFQMAQCELNEGAEALVQSLAGTQTYLARKPLGSGSITYLSLTLRDLFRVLKDEEREQVKSFFRRSLLLRRKSTLDTQQQGAWGFGVEPIDLVGSMTRFIGFEAKTTIYMLVAIVFVIAYGLLATWGAWFVLQKRNMLHYSWPAFFLTAAGASLISVMAVRANQGFGKELHQLSIIDTTVDTYAATAHCYFGLKTSSYVQDVDVLLPQGPPEQTDALRSPHYLRPLSPRIGTMAADNRFADTKRYDSQPTRAQLNNVPIRATLKQLEGYWRGSTDGQISANIRFHPQLEDGRSPFTSDSTVTNKLGHDLVNCYLIEATLDPDDTTVLGGRSETTYIHPIGTIRDTEVVLIAQRLGGSNVKGKEYPKDYTLRNFQKSWAKGSSLVLGSFAGDPFQNITREQRAIMLLSTFLENEPEIESNAGSFPFTGRAELLQTNSRWLDRSVDLTPRSLLLIGFAVDEAGPAVLYMRSGRGQWGFSLPAKAMTVYRVTIPVERES